MRNLYADAYLVPAVILMHQRRWQEAIDLLRPLADQENTKQSGKAAYNLAVAYEAMGSIPEARQWASIAAQKKAKFAHMLLAQLP